MIDPIATLYNRTREKTRVVCILCKQRWTCRMCNQIYGETYTEESAMCLPKQIELTRGSLCKQSIKETIYILFIFFCAKDFSRLESANIITS